MVYRKSAGGASRCKHLCWPSQLCFTSPVFVFGALPIALLRVRCKKKESDRQEDFSWRISDYCWALELWSVYLYTVVVVVTVVSCGQEKREEWMGWWYLLPASDHPDLPTCHPMMVYRSSLSSSPPLSSWLIFSFNQIPNRIHVHVLMSEWIRWLKATAINQEGCERSCDQDRCWKVRLSIKMRSQNKKNISKALKLNIAQNHPVRCRGRARACQSWLREGFLSIRTSSGPRAGNSKPSSSQFLWD